MIGSSFLKSVSTFFHGGQKSALPVHSQDPRTAELYDRSAGSLEVLYNETNLKIVGDTLTFSSPAIGDEALQLTGQDGEVHACQGGQELPVKLSGASRFISTHGALGTDPANKSVDLPDGSQVIITKWNSSLEVQVKKENSPVTLDLWFKEGEETPALAAFKQPGLQVAVRKKEGLSIEERPLRDGPTEGHLTTFRQGKFESRDWHDGFSDPSTTSPEDIQRVISGSTEVLSAGGALFAP